MASKLSRFLVELKRRKVYHVALAYVVVGTILAGAANDFLPRLGAPEWTVNVIIFLILIGFPIALVLAWAYEIRPEEPRSGKVAGSREPVGEPPTPGDRKSIVVLPFDNMSPDPNDAYFADGLTEEIITNLSYVRSLRVISRNSAMALKGTEKSTRAIAAELDVQYVLEGSVRKAGDELLITAQLIDGPNDAHLWAEKYAGTFDDIFRIQENVARSIVDALRIEVTSEERERIADRPIEDLRAYEFYLRANAATHGLTAEACSEARGLFRLALDAIGDNALLFSGLAWVHFVLMNMGVEIEENRAKASEAVERALDLDPDIPKAHALLGCLAMSYRGTLEDVKEAARHLQRALDADPDDVHALWAMVAVHLFVGRAEAADPWARRLQGIDPLDPFALWPLGAVYFFDGKYDMALREFRRHYEKDPEQPAWIAWYGLALAYNGEIEAAAAMIEPSASAHPDNAHLKLARMQVRALKGDKQGVLSELGGSFQEWFKERTWATRVAAALALLDERDEALDWLEHAVNRGWINYPLLSEGDPWLQNLRGEERFRELMVRVKREWESFEI
jgi:TolB-like protein/thioredoxin-like negative regulator of GroEL